MSTAMHSFLRFFCTWVILMGFVNHSESIKCYRCIALDCPNDPSICKSIERFVRRQIPHLYFARSDIPVCPLPPAEDRDNYEWKRLTSTSPSMDECPGSVKKNERTCILGRLQVQTQTTETRLNYTSHGTIMGCATPELLTSIKKTTEFYMEREQKATDKTALQFDDEDIISLPSIIVQKQCHSDKVQSPIEHSLQHFMEIEHCAVVSDMCFNHDYCVEPRESVVKPFVISEYESRNIGLFTTIFIWGLVVFGLVILIVTFLGIKYN